MGTRGIERPKSMKMKQQAAPEYTTDADGQQLVHIALANSNRRATLYAEDFQRLTAAGFSSRWQYTEDGRGSAYVTLTAYTRDGHNRVIPVARLLADAGHGERVRCSDGNTLNLRIENLSIYLGRAWFPASDWFPTTAALRAAGIAPAVKTKPRRTHAAPARPAVTPQTPAATTVTERAPAAPREPYTPPTIDTKATAQRVRERVAAGVSYNGGTCP